MTLDFEAMQRPCGAEMGTFDWDLTEFLTLATPERIEEWLRRGFRSLEAGPWLVMVHLMDYIDTVQRRVLA